MDPRLRTLISAGIPFHYNGSSISYASDDKTSLLFSLSELLKSHPAQIGGKAYVFKLERPTFDPKQLAQMLSREGWVIEPNAWGVGTPMGKMYSASHNGMTNVAVIYNGSDLVKVNF